MRDLLKGPLTFDGAFTKLSNMPVIGKTGTTNSVTDFLFAGLTPYYSGAVWIGYDDRSQWVEQVTAHLELHYGEL